jgi:hypothetical protein
MTMLATATRFNPKLVKESLRSILFPPCRLSFYQPIWKKKLRGL